MPHAPLQDVADVASSLPVGGMAHHPSFTLHVSMSCVEIMDPKTDPGVYFRSLTPVHARLANGAIRDDAALERHVR